MPIPGSVERACHALAATILFFGPASSQPSEASEQPNIVVILADDMGYGDPRCYNPDSSIPTPHMDRLAREGTRFLDAHAGASVCTPSRYSLLTGRYCWRTRLQRGVVWTTFDEPLIEVGRMTIGKLAQAHGYRTAVVGKWHLGMNLYEPESEAFARGKRDALRGLEGCREVDFTRPAAYSPNDVGFDFSFVSGAGNNMEPYAFFANRKAVAAPSIWRRAGSSTGPDPHGDEVHEGWMSAGWRDDAVDFELTRQAVAFVERHQEEAPERPFLLYFAPCAPHRPCVPAPEFRGKSGKGAREDCIAQLDHCVGRVLEVLDRLELTESTLVLLTSDNGAVLGEEGHPSNGELRGRKASLFEGGHRVPFIARWPGEVPAGATSAAPLQLTGLLATMAELFGVELPRDAGEDSVSFLGALRGEAVDFDLQPGIVHHSFQGNFALRRGKWKLIPGREGRRGTQKPPQLFDLEADPSERTDVAEHHPERVAELSALLARYRESGRSRD